jgi:CO/xanthine dehydrogenase FAD-binding subunit
MRSRGSATSRCATAGPSEARSPTAIPRRICRRSSSRSITFARIGVTGVSDHAYRATAVEEALAGGDGSRALLDAAAAHVTVGRTVSTDIHADREYRTAMAAVYTRRAIEAALARFG